MTRAEMKAQAVGRAFQIYRTSPLPDPGFGDPFFLDNALNNIVDRLTRAVHVAYLFYTTDITSGTARYCPCALYEIDGAILTLADGTRVDLTVRKAEEFKVLYPDYLSSPPMGTPSYLVTEGLTGNVLFPTPDFTAADALELRGLGLHDASLWSAETDPCPLPDRFQMTAVHGLASEIAADDKVILREMRAYEYEKGHLESEMANYADSARSRANETAYRYPTGPLNL